MTTSALPPQKPPRATGPLTRLATAASRTSALVIVCLALIALNAIQFFATLSAASNTEPLPVAFVKLHPSGSYYVSYHDADMPFSIFESTINSMLRKAVQTRFRENPDTIRADYNVAALFLGSRELERFINEFDAPAKIEEITTCTSCPIVEPNIQALQHLENLSPEIGPMTQGRITRSTMYLTLEYRDRRTGRLIRSENKILPIEWHLDPRKISAIAAGELSLAVLNHNPIGLTILSWNMTDDRTSGD